MSIERTKLNDLRALLHEEAARLRARVAKWEKAAQWKPYGDQEYRILAGSMMRVYVRLAEVIEDEIVRHGNCQEG